ncbi:MAG: hypothetical protein LQ348_002726 [Seirophora lacunosa]|nr:MAG: hypothetical protein LQ348_002726 [Seirophora lacunosa]
MADQLLEPRFDFDLEQVAASQKADMSIVQKSHSEKGVYSIFEQMFDDRGRTRGSTPAAVGATATFTAEHLDAGESVVRADAFYLSAAAMLPGPSSLPAPSAAQKDVA